MHKTSQNILHLSDITMPVKHWQIQEGTVGQKSI